MEVHRAGKRSLAKARRGAKSTPMSAFEQGSVGECRINTNQMAAIQHLYHTSPSIQAARTILMGQLLGSGLQLTREGKAVKLTSTFSKYLESQWIPFAREVVDHTLMYGMCVVSIEEENPPPFSKFINDTRSAHTAVPAAKRRKPPGGSASNASSGQPGDTQAKSASEGAQVVASAKGPPNSARNLVPVVPVYGTYEVVLTPSGRAAYARRARVFTTAPAHAYTEDPYAGVFFRNEPDVNGNLVSPVASAFEFASFVNALRELALSAEVVRATPTLVTQSAPRINTASAGGVDTASLFFDSESRAVHQQQSDAEASERTQQLGLTVRLAAELNRLRTTVQDAGAPGSGVAGPSALPPEVPPRLFALPDKQQLVPNALQPQARTDLESLMRLANDHIAAAMGVPASVVFEGRFSSNSMSQLQLLNTTVASIALFVNSVLTTTYNAIYGAENDDGELILVVAPLAANKEVEELYKSGIIDYETAMPAALHSLGCSAEEIASAMQRRRDSEAKEKAMSDERQKTEKAELKARAKVAANPQRSQTGAGSSAVAPAAPTPKAAASQSDTD